MMESNPQIFRCQENVQIFGGATNAGVLLQGKSAGDGIGDMLLLKQSKHFTEECFLPLRHLHRNRRGQWYLLAAIGIIIEHHAVTCADTLPRPPLLLRQSASAPRPPPRPGRRTFAAAETPRGS